LILRTTVILIGFLFIEPLFGANCDQKPQMGDWKKGTESREEAAAYQTQELADSIETFLDCLEATVPSQSRSAAAHTSVNPSQSHNGGGARNNSNSDGDESSGDEFEIPSSRSNGVASAHVPDVNPAMPNMQNSTGYLDENLNPESIELEGSYAKALREAHASEKDKKIRAALAAEYKKLTGRSI